MSILDNDVRTINGVGEKKAKMLHSLGIDTVGALLRFYPRAYENWSEIKDISDCFYDEKVCIRARVITPVTKDYKRKNMILYRFTVTDDTGNMEIVIFNNKYLAERLVVGAEYLFSGKVNYGKVWAQLPSPEIRRVGDTGIVPIYRSCNGLSSAAIEKLIRSAICTDFGDDPLPQNIREKNRLVDLNTAINNIHFPKSEEALNSAKRRLIFEELFILQTGLMLLKGKNRRRTPSVIKKDFSSEFFGMLPFSMTDAQKKATAQCISDMSTGRAMNRLIQGDVGSGKTAVAAAVMYVCARNGFQSAIMAPTEVLAEQHYNTLCEFFKNSKVRVCLLTGSMTQKQKQSVKEQLRNGEFDVIVGTHALLTEDTEFKNLALVITDEQHRFGVGQRATLAAKGERPHTLVMSATPIPRTLGLIIYGDLDISIIDEYPKGRQEISTYLVDGTYRNRVYNFIKQHIDKGLQGYIVCPLVEENEDINIKSAEEYFEKLKNGQFCHYRLGLLHGKMRPKDKESVMREFKDGNIDLLICTTVIEVGIDVPNAAVMLIENAERFGLSQLHQLRGRIGRGKEKSSCILISDAKSDNTKKRLEVIRATNDGFKIADEDLRLRGPGDFLGNRQHGLPELKIADICTDSDMLKLAGFAAAQTLETDAHLKSKENAALREEIIRLYKKLNEN